jgi:hypothetical protein
MMPCCVPVLASGHQLVKMTPEGEKDRGVRVTVRRLPAAPPTRKSVEDGVREDLR